jgi:phage baseplate assembly protein W
MNLAIQFKDPAGNDFGFTHADLATIDFGAAGVKEILQNVRTLLLTPKYSVPLNRLMGMTFSVIDSPISEAPDLITVDILDVITRYEPRVTVLDLDFDFEAAQQGKLGVTLKLKLSNVTYRDRLPYAIYPIPYTWNQEP